MYNLISDIVGGVEFIVLEENLQAVAPVAPPAYAAQKPHTNGGTVDMATQENPVTTVNR
jgi:hypothetical protein